MSPTPAPRWRRRTLLAGACLVAGLALNLAVSWWLCSYGQYYTTVQHNPREAAAWPEWVPDDWPPWQRLLDAEPGAAVLEEIGSTGITAWFQMFVPGRPSSTGSAQAPTPGLPAAAHVVYISTGLPLRAFQLRYGAIETAAGTPTRTRAPGLLGGLTVPWAPGSDRLVPIAPVWPGAVVNTFLYAAVLGAIAWSARAGFLRFLHTRRRRRGLCPACAYDLRGLGANVCPECGTGSVSPP